MKEGRSTVYNSIVTEEKLSQCNPKNIELANDFLDYLTSIDRSPTTIISYRSDLYIFFIWDLEFNNNKYFVDLSKREIAKFQNHAINVWGWSPNRIRRVKSALSSMSNYIENILDDEIPDFKPIVRKIENPVKETVREKTVLTEEQVTYLLDTLLEQGKLQNACAVALATFSGARKSELARFKVDYFADENIIYDAIWRTPEKIKTKGRGGKMGKPLTKYVLLDFKKYLDPWLEKRKELGIESEWLLVSKQGDDYGQIKISTLDSYAEICGDILGVPFYFHSLRHYLCTKLLSYNLPPMIVKEWNGWKDLSLVDIYNDREISEDFEKYFSADGIKQVDNTTLSDL